MVPPFLAYFGAVTNNQTLVQAAFDQIAAYRKGLQDGETKLWRHMSEGPEAEDPNLWATGNAWAAAGIMRVLATIKRSQFAGSMGDQMTQLQVWAAEILSASKTYMVSGGRGQGRRRGPCGRQGPAGCAPETDARPAAPMQRSRDAHVVCP
jgi:hypothetical protein